MSIGNEAPMYPVKFLYQNPEGKLLFEAMQPFSKELGNCPWTGVSLGKLYGKIHQQFNALLPEKLGHRINHNDYEALLRYSYCLEPHFNAFVPYVARGQRIVSIGPSLCEGFENTDLKGLKLSDFNLPFESVYLQLENCAWVAETTGTSFEVEGVLVYRLGGLDGSPSLRIVLCPKDWDYKSTPIFLPSLIVKGEDYHADCGQMANLALETDLADIQVTRLRTDPNSSKTLGEVLRIQTKNGPVYEKALNLVLNAFAFMSGYPEQTSLESFHSDAPERLVKQVSSGSPKEKARALSKLQGLGFAPYFKVGREMEDELSASMGRTSREGVRPHLRRGHWMSQAYGQGRALRKLMWRKPCVVGAQDAALPVPSVPQRI